MKFGKKIIIILLLFAAFASFPYRAHAAGGGSFVLAVSTDSATVIEPERIEYSAGMTVKEALVASGHSFTGIEQGFISAIDGTAGSYVRFHDHMSGTDNYDLDIPAEDISMLLFSETTVYSEAIIRLVLRLADYRDMDPCIRNYPEAASAYSLGVRGLRRADAEEAQELLDALNGAMDDYAAILNGEKYTVDFTVTQNGRSVSKAQIRMTDEYGNITEATGTSVRVVAGTYSYAVSDGKWNRTEGRIQVTGNGMPKVYVALPYGEWFGEELRMSAGTTLTTFDGKEFSGGSLDLSTHTAVFPVQDSYSGSPTIYVSQGKGLPDENAKLYAFYTQTDGTVRTAESGMNRKWESKTTQLKNLVPAGMEGVRFTMEAWLTSGDTTQIQSLEVTLQRVPTLTGLSVTDEDGTVQRLLPSFDSLTESYELSVCSDAVTVNAVPYAPDYTVSGSGELALKGDTDAKIRVDAGNGTRSYVLHIKKTPAAEVTLSVPAGCTAEVEDADGNRIAEKNGRWQLIPGAEYRYVGTLNEVYHSSAVFTAADGLNVSVARPETDAAIMNLELYDKSSTVSRVTYQPDGGFESNCHSYTVPVPDYNSSCYARADVKSGYTVTARYCKQHIGEEDGDFTQITINTDPESSKVTALLGALAQRGYGQEMVFRAERTEGTVSYYQDYKVSLCRTLHLKSLSLEAEGAALTLTDESGNGIPFSRNGFDYRVQVSNVCTGLALSAAFTVEPGENRRTDGYYAEISGVRYDSLSSVSLALDTRAAEETLTVRVLHADGRALCGEYRIHVIKKEPVPVVFRVSPQNANVFLLNEHTGASAYVDESGTALLPPGSVWSYTVTASGYIGVERTACLVPENGETITVELEKAPQSSHTLLNAQWPSFRADANNNGVVNYKTPVEAEEAVLYWATKLGDGYSADACGCPIIVDGCLYTYARNSLYRVDCMTGAVLAEGEMDHSSSFAINSPTYAEGMIFVGLSDGCVQAFDAETLRSLWIYRDPLKGQPNCPIYYHDGYIYTGFWLGETSNANFVCISVTDEQPSMDKEEKLATWRYTSLGGYYWAGAYVCDDYCLVPTDDGDGGYTVGHARLLSLDPKSGRLIDSVTLPHPGDARSSVTMVGNMAYFTTKGGYFYGVSVDPDGTLGTLRYIRLDNYDSNPSAPPMSTCTPTVYNNRAYIGVSGVGQFTAYSGHNITVLDLTDWEIAYTVRTQGYPQTSGLLTTAYDEGDGMVYVYFFDNYTPGKLRILRDRPGQKTADLTDAEEFMDKGRTISYVTAATLFTPDGEQAQYAICSPIADAYGTIYFKNDSAYLMAVGSTVEKLEIIAQPDKTTYHAGEFFDPAGMKVTATYANGLTRDVTAYVRWSEEPLTVEDSDFAIRYELVMYQNAEGKAGSEYTAPAAYVTLNIKALPLGDVNADGFCDNVDSAMLYGHIAGTVTLEGEALEAADVNRDGKVDETDAALIYDLYRGMISQFPDESSSKTER